jgi:hypothetical protein
VAAVQEDTMKDQILKEFKDVADILQGWEAGKNSIGYSEVLVWLPKDDAYKGICVAFRGDALRIELRSFRTMLINNQDHCLDLNLQRIFGFSDVEPKTRINDRWSTRVIGVSGGVGQTMTAPDEHISQVLNAVSVVVTEYLERRGLAGFEVWPTLMPNEGYPWEPGTTVTPYYSAKTRRVELGQKPDWITKVEVRSDQGGYMKVPGADLCKIVPTLKSDPGGSVMIHDPSKNLDFMVTHAFDFFRTDVGWKEISKLINGCGGLLFPSLGVSQIPAAAIGLIVFAIDPLVVLQGLKPYRSGRGRWPVVLYAVDAWTETTHTFLGEAAALTYAQLTGQWQPGVYTQDHHFYVLGPRIVVPEQKGNMRIDDTKRLSSVIAHRAKVWHRGLSAEQVEAFRDVWTPDRYPYLESKVNGIVGIDALTACVVPSFLMSQAEKMLTAINFRGVVLPIRVSGERAKALKQGSDYGVLYEYSWQVYDAIAEYARSSGRVEILRF